MWKWILQAFQIASAINMRRSIILFVLELLRQFDLSLVKSAGQSNAKSTRKAGFVYVIRDKAKGERFKSGYRARAPWRDRQLRSQMGRLQDFVLIIPAKDASALEKRLRRTYGKTSNKSEWFELEDYELLEIMTIAAVVMVVAGDNLGMSAVSIQVVQQGKKLLAQLFALASAKYANKTTAQQPASTNDRTSESTPDIDDFSTIPVMDWEWESVLDKNYRDLPKAKGKSGYICIIRDNDARRGKIFFVDHPVESIEAAFLETSLRFPLEIVMILKVDKIKSAAESLLSPSERKKGDEWVELTPEELGEYKQSAKGAFVHGSLYVGPKTHWGLETLDADKYRDFTKLEKPAGYVCAVQGVNPGSLYKIWETSHPKGLEEDRLQSRELNNLHDMLTAQKPINFHVILECKYSESFREFLQERYHMCRRRSGWFELDDAQLEEIRNMGRKRR